MDTKVVFQKELIHPYQQPEIELYKDGLNNNLEQLAYLSGIHSRFQTDPRLKQGEFQKLYKIWIGKAWETNQVYAAPDLAGMVTVSVELSRGSIGLIAVSEKHQGKGWGKKLVKAAEFECWQEGAREILIPTQESNIPACGLYKSLGYKPSEKTYIYHYWNIDFQSH
ncbi:GNAT family N-acetyltransferase [Algoriphagus sp. NG3]|uniref:GNAT family N-acetyltransferase n=1 Tax=unclassified Algoriphagus TaxID=2641541 RepID=UPI002A7FC53B|nr:GNAT family N-acetyltransferase [Algoriphagus sp. NG3]WPR77412.1 GNAT family N-acetyltransferase [Algoriphagus sp. NG3]